MNVKSLLLSSVMLLGCGWLSAQSNVGFNWYSPLLVPSTKAQTSVLDMKVASDGQVYTLGQFGSHTPTSVEATFLGESFDGAPYVTGTSYNANVMLMKHDCAGHVSWNVYSDMGDLSVSDCAFTPLADGGAFLALKVRHTNNNEQGNNVLLRMVGADGVADSVSFVWPDSTYRCIYQPVLVRIDGNGAIADMRLEKCDWSAAANATTYSWGTSNGFYFYDADVDAQGNIFLVGRMARDLVFGTDTIAHHNTDMWTGDSQTASGNAFIVKLDSNMDYVDYLTTTGTSSYEYFQKLIIKNNKLYISGMLLGDGINTVGIGTETLNPSDTISLLAAKVDASDLSVDWVTIIPGSKVNAKNTFQLNAMTLDPNATKIYLAGGVQGSFVVNGQVMDIGTTTTYNGFALKIDASTGQSEIGLVDAATAIINNFGVVATSDSVYLYGYNWGEATDKIYLQSYDSLFAQGTTYAMVSGGGSSTAATMVAYGDTLVIGSRVQANKETYFLNGTDTFISTYTWTGGVSSYTFPGYAFTAAESLPEEPVGTLDTPVANYQIYSRQGELIIVGAQGETLQLFNALGQQLKTSYLQQQTEVITLPSGIYLVRIGNTGTKIVIY